MLAKLYRFHGYGSLRGVYKRGQVARGQLINLKFEARGNQKIYRAAVVVSKKVHKSAVIRNQIRRRVYEIVRQQTKVDLNGYDLVFTVFSEEVAALDQTQLEANIKNLLQKAINQSATPTPLKTPAHDIVKSKGK